MVKIVVVHFDAGKFKYYELLNSVLQYSIRKNMPDSKIIDIKLKYPEVDERMRMLVANTIKLEKWVEVVCDSKKTEKIVLLDCDMLMIRSVEDIFDMNFDVCYTYRKKAMLPLNGGVMFSRGTEKAKSFFEQYLFVNNKMLYDEKFHSKWRKKYAGINQAALGWMIEKSNHDANLIKVPCDIWNVCDDSWKNLDGNSRIIHIKGRLRKIVLHKEKESQDVMKAVNMWRAYRDEWADNK